MSDVREVEQDAEVTPPDETPAPQPAPAARPGRKGWRRVRVTAYCTGVFVVVLLCAVALGAVWTVRHSYPQTSGTVSIPGLHHRVTVTRDANGIPQVYADDTHDLFLAQGYVHAQDRFWEMDVRRHITAGRLAEMFGPDLVSTDEVVRTMGWYRVAQQEVSMLSPQSRGYLQAYADGVNDYLAQRSGSALSVEYPVLGFVAPGYTVEPWTPADSVSWLKAMAWDLNGTLADQIQHALLAATLPPDRVAELFPTYDFDRWQTTTGLYAGPTTNPGPSPAGDTPGGPTAAATGAAVLAGTAAATAHALADTGTALTRLDAVLGPRGKAIGSNAWVVAGSLTTTGMPMLENDPHLSPSMPGVWYQIGLHCTAPGPSCPFDVTGFSFSGMPGVVIGHNNRIAWGLTNLVPADTDLYLEKVTGQDYEYQGRRYPLETRTEVIKAAGADPTTIVVRSTRHGPLLSDVMDDARSIGTVGREPGVPKPAGTYAVAIKWTALEPHRTMDAVFEIDAATDWTSFRAAAADFAAPTQNMLYADRDGNIGYQTPGLIPIRTQGDARYPVPGWTGTYEWTGYIPFDKLPTLFDPPSGYIVSANNAVVGPAYPYMITDNWGDGYRSQRIIDLIHQAGKLDVAEMTRIESDTYNANAATLTPYLFGVTPGPAALKARELLRGWDYTQPVDSAAAAYFNAVWRSLLRLTFDDDLAGNPATLDVDGGGQWFDVVRDLLKQPDNPWWRNSADPRHLRTRDDVIRAAEDDAAAELTSTLGPDPTTWRWGALHQLTLENETLGSGGPAPVQWLLNRGPYEVAGGTSTVDATGWDAPEGYEVNWVPSMRMVVDLGNLDASRWINLTGASGHAFAPTYDDQVPLWLAGKTLPCAYTRAAVDGAARDTLHLVPS
jgi:penicillin amidase